MSSNGKSRRKNVGIRTRCCTSVSGKSEKEQTSVYLIKRKSKRKCWYTYQERIYVVPGIIPFCSSTRRRCEPFQQRGYCKCCTYVTDKSEKKQTSVYVIKRKIKKKMLVYVPALWRGASLSLWSCGLCRDGCYQSNRNPAIHPPWHREAVQKWTYSSSR